MIRRSHREQEINLVLEVGKFVEAREAPPGESRGTVGRKVTAGL